MDFGKAIIFKLPDDHTNEEFEAVIVIVITVWNAVVIDCWNKNNQCEKDLLSTIGELPREGQLDIKRLIKRKKTKYYSDIRGVGEYWIREDNGEALFGCEARLNVENIPAVSTQH